MVACFKSYAPVTPKKVILHQREIFLGGNKNSAGLMAMLCQFSKVKKSQLHFEKIQQFYDCFIYSEFLVNRLHQVNHEYHTHQPILIV